MYVEYNNLLKIMIDKGINKTQLKDLAKLSTNVIAKIGKNEPISLESIQKICIVLDCDIGDVVRLKKE